MSNFKSLILNDNLSISFDWDLWAAEVDLLSIAIKGEKTKITNEDIHVFLSGALDSMVMFNCSQADKRELAILLKQREGKSEIYLDSYLRGWDSAEKTLKQTNSHEQS